MKPPCLRFKPNAARVVKLLGLGCFLILATALGPSRARAQDAQDPLDSIDAAQAPNPPPESGLTTPSVPGDVGGELPKIRARTFPARVLKKSRSAKMYLFDDPGEEVPPTGKIILLKKDGVPTMALRVLKTYPENNHYAAKRVRTYNETQVLNEGDSFDAVEKMGDIAPVPPPVTTPQDKADLNELEGGTGTGSGPGELELELDLEPAPGRKPRRIRRHRLRPETTWVPTSKTRRLLPARTPEPPPQAQADRPPSVPRKNGRSTASSKAWRSTRTTTSRRPTNGSRSEPGSSPPRTSRPWARPISWGVARAISSISGTG